MDDPTLVTTNGVVGQRGAACIGIDDLAVRNKAQLDQRLEAIADTTHQAITIIQELCDRFLRGDIQGAAEMQCRYHRLIDALFSEVNPIPVKAAMAAMGYCKNYLRLPLTTMEESNYRNLLDAMREVGIKV